MRFYRTSMPKIIVNDIRLLKRLRFDQSTRKNKKIKKRHVFKRLHSERCFQTYKFSGDTKAK